MRSWRGMLFAVATSVAALAGTPAWPAETSPSDPAAGPSPEDAPRSLQPITVTGSHIKRTDADGPFPVVTIDREDMLRVGTTKLGDYLPYLPFNFGSVDPTGNLPRDGAAARAFNLRGLGADATLTLLDGTRVAPYGTRDSEDFVNINAIPLAAIERIEILKEGASAIYGADAVAGVVNIILRDDYEGVDVNVGYFDTEGNGADRQSAEILAGRSFGNTNVTGVLSWFDEDPLYTRDRDVSKSADARGRGGYNRRSINSEPPNLFSRDAAINEGRFDLSSDPACPDEGFVAKQEFDPRFGNPICFYNFHAVTSGRAGSERWSGVLFVNHDLPSGIAARLQLGYDDTDSESAFAPQVAISSALEDSFTGRLFVPASHPDNPVAEDVEIYYRISETGLRVSRDDAEGRRAAFFLEGQQQLGSRAWDWRTHAAWSDNEVTQDESGNFNILRIQEALLGQGGPSGDQTFNPFGAGTPNDPDLLEYFAVNLENHIKRRERSVGALLSSAEIIDLPVGPLGVALGVEFRDQDQWQGVDEAANSGELSQGNAQPEPLSADRSVSSAFAELDIPVIDTLEIQLAARYEDYDDFGSETSPKLGVRWQPLPSLVLRAGYAEAFHAPGFRDLFDLPTESTTFVVDSARCPITGDEIDCDFFPYASEVGGNPDLDPEKVDSTVAGLVWRPEYLADLELSLDFWRFEYDDRIGFLGFQDIVDSFGLDPDYVERADPTPEDEALGAPGRIILIKGQPINLSELETQGLDMALRLGWQWSGVGDFFLDTSLTYIDQYEFDGVPQSGLNGQNLASASAPGLAIPELRSVFTLGFSRGGHALNAVVRYTDEYRDLINKPDENGRETDERHEVDDWTVLDLQYGYRFDRLGGGHLQVGCQNCTDETPPLAFQGIPAQVNLGEHDIRMRAWYARWTQPFGQTRRD